MSMVFFFFSSRRRHTRLQGDWSSDVCSSDLKIDAEGFDLPILETLEDLVRSQRPFLQVEMFSLRKSSTAYRLGLYDFLVRHGYAVHRVEGNADYLGDRITSDNLMRWNVYDVFCIPSS